MLLYIIKKEGFGGCYSGFGATMLNTFSMQYAYFFFYSLVRTSYIKRLMARAPVGSVALPALSTAAELSLGALAGALAQIFTIPVSVIATRQQVGNAENSLSSSGSLVPDNSFLGVAREIIQKEGVTGLWLGLKPSLVLTVNPAITYGMFERVKGIVLLARVKTGGSTKLTPGLSFLIGALSKTLATVVTYPYIFAKVRIQARGAHQEVDIVELPNGTKKPHHLHDGAIDILAKVWKDKGIVGWYQGMSAQIIKAVLSQALLFMSKEQFEHWAFILISIFNQFAHS
jgi:hypothetical protein